MSSQPSAAAEIQQFADSVEFGARAVRGAEGMVVGTIAFTWSLFQLWFASPLPYIFDIGVLNDDQARHIHLAFALLLGFAISPFMPRLTRSVPLYDWALGLIGAGVCLFGLIFYRDLAARAGQPNAVDLAMAAAGVLLVLEATRRSMGPFIVLVAIVFLAYCYGGTHMPEVLQHHGASAMRILEHQWLSSQGVYGVPLGASASFVFIYVLFGTLFNQAGAGNYMMQLSLAFLGHMRGGPAKVAVVSSGLNGMISGSSLANVVSGGIFTIPLMKKTGMSGIKAGAIETAASIDGQIMPPVMGAAAFIMVEYVGIPYAEIVRHAFLPAVISYIALFYIVHLESLRAGIRPIKRANSFPWRTALLRYALGLSGSIAVVGAVYSAITALAAVAGPFAPAAIGVLLIGLYVTALVLAARHPDLPPEAPNQPIETLPAGWEIARSGLHLLIPVIVLTWCLMVVGLSPALAAFWATVSIFVIMLTQEPVKRLLRGQSGAGAAVVEGLRTIGEGLVLTGRNMVGIALATATAGLIVGAITLTGLGLMMTDAVGVISGGNFYLVLLLTALITLILGCGVPTTANYVLVATLMAPVVVELGSEAGIAIPLIAVHLFVFYFGIMADATPPVGLGAYAAAAISGELPIATAVQASLYSLRTAILGFVMIFNPEILLIDVGSIWHGILIAVASIVGCLAFAAATLRYWMVRTALWETLALLIVSLSLIYPAIWLDLVYPKYKELPPAAIYETAQNAGENARLVVRFEGTSIEGDRVSRMASLRLGPAAPAAQRLAFSGLQLARAGDKVSVAQVQFGSYASRIKLETGFKVASVNVAADRPSTIFVYLIAFIVLGLVALSQSRRLPKDPYKESSAR